MSRTSIQVNVGPAYNLIVASPVSAVLILQIPLRWVLLYLPTAPTCRLLRSETREKVRQTTGAGSILTLRL